MGAVCNYKIPYLITNQIDNVFVDKLTENFTKHFGNLLSTYNKCSKCSIYMGYFAKFHNFDLLLKITCLELNKNNIYNHYGKLDGDSKINFNIYLVCILVQMEFLNEVESFCDNCVLIN